MKTGPATLVVYTKDIALITRQSERTARRLMKRIREKYNRTDNSFISIQDFCAFTGISEDKTEAFLRERG